MKKMSTLYKMLFDYLPNNKGRIFKGLSQEINQENSWVFTDKSTRAYRKLDGTACAIINGKMYAIYMVKTDKNKQRQVPKNGIPAQELPDANTKLHPYWVPTEGDAKYKWHNHAYNLDGAWNHDGTYELVGKKINANKEGLDEDAILWNHNDENLLIELPDEITFESLRELIASKPWEGIVFKNDSGQLCKLRRCDFGLKY